MPKVRITSKEFSRPDSLTADYWLATERLAYREGFSLLAGVDEVGRGCLAGPVLAAAVIFPKEFFVPGIDDSKKLSHEQRCQYDKVIKTQAISWAIALVNAAEIDRVNILQASLMAMKKAIEKLSFGPDFILVDGRDRIPQLSLPQKPLIGGDGRSISIAAASIIAKVARDRLMGFYGRQYPHYFFGKNKGYGTREHREGLAQHGPCPLHRRTFFGVTVGETQEEFFRDDD